MSKFKKEFEFTLTEPLTYQCSTGEQKVEKLLFRAPSNKHGQILGKLRKELVKFVFQSSLKNNNQPEPQKKGKKADTSTELDASTILFILYGSEFELTTFNELFWELILDDLCFVTKDIPLTASLRDNIYYEDLDMIMGEYTANFIVPLWLKRQLKT